MPARMIQVIVVLLLVVGVASSASASIRVLHSDSTAWLRATVDSHQETPEPGSSAVDPSPESEHSWLEHEVEGSGEIESDGGDSNESEGSDEDHSIIGTSSSKVGRFGRLGQMSASAVQPISQINTLGSIEFRPLAANGQVLPLPEPPSILALATFATALFGLAYKRKRRIIS